MPNPSIVRTHTDGSTSALFPVTLKELKKDEKYLEGLIEQHPELLELEGQVKGIRGPYKIFRQYELKNAMELGIIPDLIIFTASGHVIIVEVKLSGNPELRNRKALSQVIDYSSAFIDIGMEELLPIFQNEKTRLESWEELIESFFPKEPYVETIAEHIEARLKKGEVHLVIACDKAPAGLSRLLSGVSRQSALPFELTLAEITPYVDSNGNEEDMFFISKVLLRTNTVSRTVVTVQYSPKTEEKKPTVNVQATSMDDIEQRLQESEKSRFWSNEELEEEFAKHEKTIIRKLFTLAREGSNTEQFASPGKKRNPAFGFYLRGRGPDTKERTRQVYNFRLGDPHLRIYLNMISSVVSEEKNKDFIEGLSKLFPSYVDGSQNEPFIPLEELQKNFEVFKDLIQWLIGEECSRNG